MNLVQGLRSRRTSLRHTSSPPVVVWEPIPDLCTPSELSNLQEASTFVDVISPNGEELAEFFATGDSVWTREDMVRTLLGKCGDNPPQAIVVRDGADGSRLYHGGKVVHLRAYHQDAELVVDPTGGGNTYLGGLTMALTTNVVPDTETTLETLGLSEGAVAWQAMRTLSAAIHATIAASFAIEQIGVPVLGLDGRGSWNGELYEDRYLQYLQRERAYLVHQLGA